MWCEACTQAADTKRAEETKKLELYKKIMQAREDPLYHVWTWEKPWDMKEVYIEPPFHMAKEEKLEWIRLDLPRESADLDAFAAKYKELFESTISSEKAQKSSCLDLYRDYARVKEANVSGEYESVDEYRRLAYSNGVDIPAREIQGFEKVWDPDAPARCLVCKAKMPKECTDTKCKTCIVPTKKKYRTTCIQAARGGECGGEVAEVNGCFVCKQCGHGATFATAAHIEPEMPPAIKEMGEVNSRLHNHFNFKTEETEEGIEERQGNKRKRL